MRSVIRLNLPDRKLVKTTLENMKMEIIGGLRVIVDPKCVEKTLEPVMEHAWRYGQSLSYHKRIQKKWVKRWGMRVKPGMVQAGDMLVVHPALYAQLRESATQTTKQHWSK